MSCACRRCLPIPAFSRGVQWALAACCWPHPSGAYSMWFFGGSAEPELPADEDEAARAEMEMEQDLLGEMNRQMVEAKLQLEAERVKSQQLTERVQELETALAVEREQRKQEMKLLEEQVGDLSRKNNDLSWSNEELLRMKRSDEAYEELQDTRAMMEALKALAEDLYKKVALSKVMLIAERRRARLRISLANWSLAAAGISRRHALSVEMPHPVTGEHEEEGEEGEVVLLSKEERVEEVRRPAGVLEGEKHETVVEEEKRVVDELPPPPPPTSITGAVPAATPAHEPTSKLEGYGSVVKPARLMRDLLRLKADVSAILVDVQESIRWRQGLLLAGRW